MAISKALSYLSIDDLLLDPLNPRLGRDKRKIGLDQASLLAEMSSWTLEELIDSFVQAGGFWTQDALIVIAQIVPEGQTGKYLVVEGNRRLAALKLLYGALKREIEPPRWLSERLETFKPTLDDELFTKLPVLIADKRDDVLAYLGFRHVTGIKQWRPAEKAEFIVSLIDDKQLTYRDVARQIGSRSDTVRQNYIAFKMLLQMEEIEGFDWSEVEERFSLLFLSIRSEGTRDFLGVELKGDAPAAAKPIPVGKQQNAQDFVGWLFGSKDSRPLVRDSRNVDKFGEILGEPRAVEYLRKAQKPDFEAAYSLTDSADLVVDPLGEAARQIRLALSSIGGRYEEYAVQEAAWPVIEGGIRLAIGTKGNNLDRAKELLGAA
jgi:hypothetical protein